MIKKTLLSVFLFTILISPAIAQDKTDLDKQVGDFVKKVNVAEWLVEYDFVAWRSTDLVLSLGEDIKSKLGPDWFCYQDSNGVWRAVYGKFDGEKYDVAAHVVEKTKEKPEISKDKIDAKMLVRYASALRLANAEVNKEIDRQKAPRFNQYIKENEDKTFSVWILPAFQKNGAAVYGGEFVFKIDSKASRVVEKKILLQDNFRFFMYKPPRAINLNFSEYERVPLHGVFFAIYYKKYFTKIRLEVKNYYIQEMKVDGDEIWAHIEKKKKESSK